MKIIEVDQVSKKFGQVVALNDVSMSVERGQIYGFIGPNGAGKTTLIRILLGILKADKGTAKMLDKDVWNEAVTIHQSIAYVPGDVKLWPNLTGGEVIDILIHMRQQKHVEDKQVWIEKFDLDPTKKCRSYSKGNRQKVALIAALASGADVYILDEPTSGLDPLMEKVFQEAILELKKRGKTVLLSSHILSEVDKLCDHVSIIRNGEIIESGKLEDMRHLTRTSMNVVTKEPIPDLKDLKGIHDYRFERNMHSFQIETRDIDTIIKHLTHYTILKFESQPPTLEDLFMHHYQGD